MTNNDWIDSEITRLTGLRDNIRESILAMEEDNAESANFEGREISHLPLSVLKDHEYEYTIKINQLIMDKQGEDFIFGHFVRTKSAN